MTDATYAILVDFAAGGLMLASVLIVWRRDLRVVRRNHEHIVEKEPVA